MKSLPGQFGLRHAGVYAAGFNWFVDYLLFPIIMISQKFRRGLMRHFWAWSLMKGMNLTSASAEGVALLLSAEGELKGKNKSVRLLLECESAYDFTVIPVIAFLKQYFAGTIRKPGLWMMGHIVDPDELLQDLQAMGVTMTLTENHFAEGETRND
jgi:hypothetical protein